MSRVVLSRQAFAALNERASFLPAPKATVNIDALSLSSSSSFSLSTLAGGACRGGKAGVATTPRGRIRALTIFTPPLRSPDTFSCAYCYDCRFARRFAVGSAVLSLSLPFSLSCGFSELRVSRYYRYREANRRQYCANINSMLRMIANAAVTTIRNQVWISITLTFLRG